MIARCATAPIILEILLVERLDAKILALVDANPNALDMARWHTCETTHCRAGFRHISAGDAGLRPREATRSGARRHEDLHRVGRLPAGLPSATTSVRFADMREAATAA